LGEVTFGGWSLKSSLNNAEIYDSGGGVKESDCKACEAKGRKIEGNESRFIGIK
jgi:hypothetical protein